MTALSATHAGIRCGNSVFYAEQRWHPYFDQFKRIFPLIIFIPELVVFYYQLQTPETHLQLFKSPETQSSFLNIALSFFLWIDLKGMWMIWRTMFSCVLWPIKIQFSTCPPIHSKNWLLHEQKINFFLFLAGIGKWMIQDVDK